MPPLCVLNFTSNPPLSLVVILSYDPPLVFQPPPPHPLQVIIAQSLIFRDTMHFTNNEGSLLSFMCFLLRHLVLLNLSKERAL